MKTGHFSQDNFYFFTKEKKNLTLEKEPKRKSEAS